jgi:small-conductance mechanosensitive channel
VAAQNTLGNLIAGISIILYKPFQLGDRLEVNAPGGVENAVVEKITMGNTVLRTYDNRRVVVPNSVMVGQTIINLSSEDPRVQAIVPVGIAYSADVVKARRLLVEAAGQHPGIVEVDSCPVMALENSSVTLTLRAWSPDAATARGAEYDLFETALATFRANGIDIPFPNMTVHVDGPGTGKENAGVASG